MAHDFLGTFNRSQFERFLAFAKSQLPLIPARILHLKAEIARVGEIVFVFDDNGFPTEVNATPGSQVAKLLAAYEVLGGNPFTDLRTRTKAQALYVRRAAQGSDPQFMSDGSALPGEMLLDSPSAYLMADLREPLTDTLNYRFNSLERKIRRAVDLVDQLKQEIFILNVQKEAATIEGSLEDIADQINNLLNDPTYRAINNDNGKDPLGLTTHAPFSAYDAFNSNDPNLNSREAAYAQRQNGGYVAPGALE